MDQPLILIIDDSQTIRKLVECHLSQAGYRVAMAADAEQGLELARTHAAAVDPPGPPIARDDRRRGLPEVAGRRVHGEDPGRHQLGVAESGLRKVHRVSQRRRSDPQAVHARAAQERSGQRPSNGCDGRAGATHRLRHARGGRRGPRRPAGGDDRVIPAALRARFPEQSPADRPADTGSWQGSAALRARAAAGSRRCTRRRFARTGWRASSRPSFPISVRSWR